MKKTFFFVLLFFTSLYLFSQEDTVGHRKLDHLTRLHGFNRKYANFDVVKVMAGTSWGIGGLHNSIPAYAFEFQFLVPIALLKDWRVFHIAYGVSLGHSTIAQRNTELVFSHNNLVNIAPSNRIKKSAQKVRYAGLVILPFF